MATSFRRIVTTHDPKGLSVIGRDDVLTPQRITMIDADLQLVWTNPVPADNNDDQDGGARDAGFTLKGGAVIRIVDLLPGTATPMHRSHSIDYGIVLSGRLEMQLDGGDRVSLSAGDIVVQRGTNHLWRNPSDNLVCRVAFVLIEAAPVIIDGRALEEYP